MMHAPGFMHFLLPSCWFTAAKQLQCLHVLNFGVLIKLLNSCHITLRHQED